MSDDADAGLFYVRAWVRGSSGRSAEMKFISLKEAQAVMTELCADKAYKRVEFLECREWMTRAVHKIKT